jgi:hypothetical protein
MGCLNQQPQSDVISCLWQHLETSAQDLLNLRIDLQAQLINDGIAAFVNWAVPQIPTKVLQTVFPGINVIYNIYNAAGFFLMRLNTLQQLLTIVKEAVAEANTGDSNQVKMHVVQGFRMVLTYGLDFLANWFEVPQVAGRIQMAFNGLKERSEGLRDMVIQRLVATIATALGTTTAVGTAGMACSGNTEYDPRPAMTVTFQGMSVDRATGVVSLIRRANYSRTNFATNFPSWWTNFVAANPIAGVGWRKGHLLGSQFGGPAAKENLGPQTFLVNNSAVQQCDNRIREALNHGCVLYEINVNYANDPLRPVSFRIRAENGAAFRIDVTIQNEVNPVVPAACQRP